MRKFLLVAAAAVVLMISCGKKNDDDNALAEKLAHMSDSQRVDYLMHQMPPDSLARLVVNSALGKESQVRFDTIANAIVYIQDNLKGDSLDLFTMEYESYVEGLPLTEKMKYLKLGTLEDEVKIGFKLGTEYTAVIREKNMTADQIEKELRAFKQVCDTDTAMYRRVIKGFQTALEIDKASGVSADIYNRFKNYE